MIKRTCNILMEIRKENKLTRKALSELSGFKEITIASYEKNLRRPSKEYIRFMSLYFHVHEDYINGLSINDVLINTYYRVFEMYKEIYPQNASKVDEVFKKYDVDYSNIGLFILCENSTCINYLIKIIHELNISFLSFSWLCENLENKIAQNEIKNIPDGAILINKEFYLSVIKKRNEPNIFIPLENKTVDYTINLEIEKNLKDMNLKIISLNKEIEKNLKDMNTKINNFNQEIDKTLKDIQKIQEDLTLKKP